ncbi:hypothetical protein PROFUN_15743 [Planoprotostelium fungivorum]|uniref:Uncharacterized protein n=1 Tax=Planoprotostelium fungivorum TaxID=1890364 RepID=A0A2P6MUR2_9EUKA|nr:hypothetical protein PROFUN_15743 [Planoprotostelium fungivorum]
MVSVLYMDVILLEIVVRPPSPGPKLVGNPARDGALNQSSEQFTYISNNSRLIVSIERGNNLRLDVSIERGNNLRLVVSIEGGNNLRLVISIERGNNSSSSNNSSAQAYHGSTPHGSDSDPLASINPPDVSLKYYLRFLGVIEQYDE